MPAEAISTTGLPPTVVRRLGSVTWYRIAESEISTTYRAETSEGSFVLTVAAPIPAARRLPIRGELVEGIATEVAS